MSLCLVHLSGTANSEAEAEVENAVHLARSVKDVLKKESHEVKDKAMELKNNAEGKAEDALYQVKAQASDA